MQIPLLIVAGAADEVVPFEFNAGKLIKYCNANNIKIISIIKPTCLHHPHSLVDVSPIVDRVQNAAQLAGVSDNLYKAWSGFDVGAKGLKKVGHTLLSMGHNGLWLFSKLRTGYTVIDIGISTAHRGWGLYYGTERFVLALWETRNIWKFYIH